MNKQGKSARLYIAAMLSGLIASLALPPIGLWIALLALSLPLIAAINIAQENRSFISSALLGWMTGAGWFLFSLSWISNALITSGGAHLALIPFSLLGLPLFLGLFWAAAFGLAHGLTHRFKLKPPLHLAVLIMLITLVEYARGIILTGFPWNAPGLVMANTAWGLHIASVIGMWGSTLLIMIAAALPAMVISGTRLFGAMGAVFVILIGGGSQLIDNKTLSSPHQRMAIRILQPNIPQAEKWDFEKRRSHLATLVAQSRQASTDPLDLIIWPESAFAGFYERERGVVSAITQASSQGRTPILTGVLSLEEDPLKLYNAALLFNESGQMIDGVAKRHLVPFGEYAPFRSIIPFVDAIAGPHDFSPGSAAQSVKIPYAHNSSIENSTVKALTLICYEVIFPAAVRQSARKENVNFMITITNDAWFGNTIGPRQHLAMAQMRSAELGLPMLRSANTGISALIDGRGKIVKSLEYGRAGVVDGKLPLSFDTIYRQFGDLGYLIMMLVFMLLPLCLRLTRTKP